MRNLCCVVYLLLMMQPAFAADISAGKNQATLAHHNIDTGLPPSLFIDDEPDSGLPLLTPDHTAPAREQRRNHQHDTPHFSIIPSFQPRGPPHAFFA
ncbi:MAG: hypothetical protein R3311_09455 [Oceanisphaera sp.]|nr:hypothetical protein [Oceanisphaera sp.]